MTEIKKSVKELARLATNVDSIEQNLKNITEIVNKINAAIDSNDNEDDDMITYFVEVVRLALEGNESPQEISWKIEDLEDWVNNIA